jgi:uncharacterized protein
MLRGMAVWDEKTISVATYRKNGEAVATPTWVVPLENGRFGFWTSSAAGKVKRLRNNPQVTVQPCTNSGKLKPGTTPLTGTAELITDGPDFDTIQRDVRKKYGAMVPVTRFFNRVGHLGKGPFPYGDTGVVVTPSA